MFGTTPMVLVYLLVLLALAGSFTSEQDKGMWMILHTAKCGKGKTFVLNSISNAIKTLATVRVSRFELRPLEPHSSDDF